MRPVADSQHGIAVVSEGSVPTLLDLTPARSPNTHTPSPPPHTHQAGYEASRVRGVCTPPPPAAGHAWRRAQCGRVAAVIGQARIAPVPARRPGRKPLPSVLVLGPPPSSPTRHRSSSSRPAAATPRARTMSRQLTALAGRLALTAPPSSAPPSSFRSPSSLVARLLSNSVHQVVSAGEGPGAAADGWAGSDAGPHARLPAHRVSFTR